MCGGYYWSSHIEDLNEIPMPSEVPEEFLRKVINKIRGQINFYTIDVAQTVSGEWNVIELNDGSMSGISENDPDKLYSNMKEVLDTGKRLDHSSFCNKNSGDVADCICADWENNETQ